MNETTPDRPRQVTMAGWLAISASVLVVLVVFEQMTTFRTVEYRESIEDFLSEPPGDALGLDVAGVQQIVRITAMATAAMAAAAAVLGWYVLRRHRASRLALSILVVPLFFTGMVAGGLMASLVAAAALMLWTEPARAWFDGRPAREPAPRATGWGGSRRDETTSTDSGAEDRRDAWPAAGSTSDGPAPFSGFGASSAVSPAAGTTSVTPRGPQPRVSGRPDQAMWAAVLTWLGSGLTFLALLASAFLLPGEMDAILAEARRQNPEMAAQGVTDDMLVSMLWFFLVALLVWALAAIVLGWLVFRGREWARIALLVSTIAASVAALAALFANPLTLPLLLCCGVTLRLLMSREVTEWCRARGRR